MGWDRPDFVDFMLATGLRIGEATATTWDVLDLEAGTVEVRGTVIRVKGKGLVLKLKPKTKASYRTLMLPAWVVDMLRRRQAVALVNEWGAVFTGTAGRPARSIEHTGRPTVGVGRRRLSMGHQSHVPQDGGDVARTVRHDSSRGG